MADTIAEIPDRELFKASEVCEIAKVQPYVLRSWEQEFPNLGVTRAAGGPRVYRRTDVERVLRIKQLMFADGLTLAGVRRRLEGAEGVGPAADVPEAVDDGARKQLASIKRDLKSLLELLDGGPAGGRGTVKAESGAAQPGFLDLGDAKAGADPSEWPPKGKTGRRKSPERGR